MGLWMLLIWTLFPHTTVHAQLIKHKKWDVYFTSVDIFSSLKLEIALAIPAICLVLKYLYMHLIDVKTDHIYTTFHLNLMCHK